MSIFTVLKSLIPRKIVIKNKVDENKKLLSESYAKISELNKTVKNLRARRDVLTNDVLLLRKQAATDKSKVSRLIAKEKQLANVELSYNEFVQEQEKLNKVLQTKSNNLLLEMEQIENNISLKEASVALTESLKNDLFSEVEETANNAKEDAMKANIAGQIYNKTIDDEEIEARFSQLQKENK